MYKVLAGQTDHKVFAEKSYLNHKFCGNEKAITDLSPYKAVFKRILKGATASSTTPAVLESYIEFLHFLVGHTTKTASRAKAQLLVKTLSLILRRDSSPRAQQLFLQTLLQMDLMTDQDNRLFLRQVRPQLVSAATDYPTLVLGEKHRQKQELLRTTSGLQLFLELSFMSADFRDANRPFAEQLFTEAETVTVAPEGESEKVSVISAITELYVANGTISPKFYFDSIRAAMDSGNHTRVAVQCITLVSGSTPILIARDEALGTELVSVAIDALVTTAATVKDSAVLRRLRCAFTGFTGCMRCAKCVPDAVKIAFENKTQELLLRYEENPAVSALMGGFAAYIQNGALLGAQDVPDKIKEVALKEASALLQAKSTNKEDGNVAWRVINFVRTFLEHLPNEKFGEFANGVLNNATAEAVGALPPEGLEYVSQLMDWAALKKSGAIPNSRAMLEGLLRQREIWASGLRPEMLSLTGDDSVPRYMCVLLEAIGQRPINDVPKRTADMLMRHTIKYVYSSPLFFLGALRAAFRAVSKWVAVAAAEAKSKGEDAAAAAAAIASCGGIVGYFDELVNKVVSLSFSDSIYGDRKDFMSHLMSAEGKEFLNCVVLDTATSIVPALQTSGDKKLLFRALSWASTLCTLTLPPTGLNCAVNATKLIADNNNSGEGIAYLERAVLSDVGAVPLITWAIGFLDNDLGSCAENEQKAFFISLRKIISAVDDRIKYQCVFTELVKTMADFLESKEKKAVVMKEACMAFLEAIATSVDAAYEFGHFVKEEFVMHHDNNDIKRSFTEFLDRQASSTASARHLKALILTANVMFKCASPAASPIILANDETQARRRDQVFFASALTRDEIEATRKTVATVLAAHPAALVLAMAYSPTVRHIIAEGKCATLPTPETCVNIDACRLISAVLSKQDSTKPTCTEQLVNFVTGVLTYWTSNFAALPDKKRLFCSFAEAVSKILSSNEPQTEHTIHCCCSLCKDHDLHNKLISIAHFLTNSPKPEENAFTDARKVLALVLNIIATASRERTILSGHGMPGGYPRGYYSRGHSSWVRRAYSRIIGISEGLMFDSDPYDDIEFESDDDLDAVPAAAAVFAERGRREEAGEAEEAAAREEEEEEEREEEHNEDEELEEWENDRDGEHEDAMLIEENEEENEDAIEEEDNNDTLDDDDDGDDNGAERVEASNDEDNIEKNDNSSKGDGSGNDEVPQFWAATESNKDGKIVITERDFNASSKGSCFPYTAYTPIGSLYNNNVDRPKSTAATTIDHVVRVVMLNDLAEQNRGALESIVSIAKDIASYQHRLPDLSRNVYYTTFNYRQIYAVNTDQYSYLLETKYGCAFNELVALVCKREEENKVTQEASPAKPTKSTRTQARPPPAQPRQQHEQQQQGAMDFSFLASFTMPQRPQRQQAPPRQQQQQQQPPPPPPRQQQQPPPPPPPPPRQQQPQQQQSQQDNNMEDIDTILANYPVELWDDVRQQLMANRTMGEGGRATSGQSNDFMTEFALMSPELQESVLMESNIEDLPEPLRDRAREVRERASRRYARHAEREQLYYYREVQPSKPKETIAPCVTIDSAEKLLQLMSFKSKSVFLYKNAFKVLRFSLRHGTKEFNAAIVEKTIETAANDAGNKGWAEVMCKVLSNEKNFEKGLAARTIAVCLKAKDSYMCMTIKNFLLDTLKNFSRGEITVDEKDLETIISGLSTKGLETTISGISTKNLALVFHLLRVCKAIEPFKKIINTSAEAACKGIESALLKLTPGMGFRLAEEAIKGMDLSKVISLVKVYVLSNCDDMNLKALNSEQNFLLDRVYDEKIFTGVSPFTDVPTALKKLFVLAATAVSRLEEALFKEKQSEGATGTIEAREVEGAVRPQWNVGRNRIERLVRMRSQTRYPSHTLDDIFEICLLKYFFFFDALRDENNDFMLCEPDAKKAKQQEEENGDDDDDMLRSSSGLLSTGTLGEEKNAELRKFLEEHKVLFSKLTEEWGKAGHKIGALENLLVRIVPEALDFNLKRKWFREKVEELKENNYGRALRIRVSRDTLYEDSFREFSNPRRSLRGDLFVEFNGEPAIDSGGPTKEWYMAISQQIVNPQYGLFKRSDDGAVQPNPASGTINMNHLDYFRFVGNVVGRALWDGQLLNAHFTRGFYKQMLGRNVSMRDMEALDHEHYKGLMELHEGDADGIGATFSIVTEVLGVSKTVDLIPNGDNIEVTNENKDEYIRLVVRYKLTKSIESQMKEFMKGFNFFIPSELIRPFDEKQLEMLISGLPDFDIEDFKKNTNIVVMPDRNRNEALEERKKKYSEWFWRAVESFTPEERIMLLQFTTGMGVVPPNGFCGLESLGGRFEVNITGSTDALPTSHTCFNRIDIPPYPTYEMFREKLHTVIKYSVGFGFA